MSNRIVLSSPYGQYDERVAAATIKPGQLLKVDSNGKYALNASEGGFCEVCADKFERDMLRLRQWKYSLTASYLPADQHEDLRRDVIEQFGMDLEILSKGDFPEK